MTLIHLFNSVSVVEYASYDDMKSAVRKLDGSELNGRRLKLVEDYRGSKRRRYRVHDSYSISLLFYYGCFIFLVVPGLVLVIEAGVVLEVVIDQDLDREESPVPGLVQRSTRGPGTVLNQRIVTVTGVVASLVATPRVSHLLETIAQGLAANLKRRMKDQMKMEKQLSVESLHVNHVVAVALVIGQGHLVPPTRVLRETRK